MLKPTTARTAAWDLTALLNAADPRATLAERHLWLVRLTEWLRRSPLPEATGRETPTPVLRLKHLLNVLDRHPEHRGRVAELLGCFWRDIDAVSLFADFGFAPRLGFFAEFGHRLRLRLLPLTPQTVDLGELFALLFPHAADTEWIEAIDAATLERFVALVGAGDAPGPDWREPLLDAIEFLATAVRASGFSGPLRQRISPELLADRPFGQLAHAAEAVCALVRGGDAAGLPQATQYLRALLDTCRRAADSVHGHLAEHGVSIDLVFEVDQLRARTARIEALLDCVLSPEPARDVVRLIADLVRMAAERRELRALFAAHYSLLARRVAERNAATGEHYITRDRAEYAGMLRAAAGGGLVIAGTTYLKFFVVALGLAAFWSGFWAGVNYAASFVLIHLAHWTVATKQPAMTAPALAERLQDIGSDDAVERFVDEVTHMIRSQAAGIFGNLAVCAPVVLALQLASRGMTGAPIVGTDEARHVLHAITLLGPTALYAAFTGVLLFASSLVAGWVENWFVWHRLDSAIAWNPRCIAMLGASRAQRWAGWWRRNISGLAANVSLGLMLGLLPALAAFVALPLEVRHVTLSTGQLAAAVGALGFGVMGTAPFWWCIAGIAVTGMLNLTVSFALAFKVAMRSRGLRLADRSRIYRAIGRRLKRAPASFIVPPPAGAPVQEAA